VTFNGQPWLIFRFRTAQGENEFWLEAPVAHAFGRRCCRWPAGSSCPAPVRLREGSADECSLARG